MKVLHLFNEIKYSGAEIMYANAASTFQDLGEELYAFSTGKHEGEFVEVFVKNKIKCFHKPLPNFTSPISLIKYYIDFYSFLKSRNIDALHIHRNNRLYTLAFVARLLGVRVIKTEHNVFKNSWYRKPIATFSRVFARHISKVTFHTIGESVYNNELYYYRNPSIKITNWFDDKKFYPEANKTEVKNIREQLGIPEDKFVIISIGSCLSTKNHHDILLTVNTLRNDIDILYLHLGTGPLEQEEIALVKQLGIEENVRFEGNRKNVRDYLICSDVYVMPSRHEGLSISSIEAMACKTPSVLYDVPGLRDLIKDDDNGFLIKSDYKLLAEKVKYYSTHRDVMKQKADNAYSFVTKECNMKKNVAKMHQLYLQQYGIQSTEN